MRAAEKGTMNPARLQSIENGLTGVSRKVLEATPKQEAWPVHHIQMEIKRLCGAIVDHKTVLGCIAHLIEQGLIKECGKQTFMRESFKERGPHVKLVKDEPIPRAEKPEKRMAEKTDLLATAGRIAASQRKLADEVEEFGLACAKQIADKDKENVLVRQLKEMLKGE
jgi:hypothetical protein